MPSTKKPARARRAALLRRVDYTKAFLKDWERLSRSGRYDLTRLRAAMLLLIAGDAPLGPEWLDHPLQGEWREHRECHIGGDFLLIYRLAREPGWRKPGGASGQRVCRAGPLGVGAASRRREIQRDHRHSGPAGPARPAGAVVTADAMGCQKTIAQTIIDGGADYVLTLKDNHPTLCEEVRLWLDTEVACGRLPVHETIEKDHSRIEIRRYALGSHIDGLEAKPDWAGLQAVGRVESIRIIGDPTSTECRYFLCSLPDRDRFAAAVRGHWSIENSLHWCLDVCFGEDDCRVRLGHAAENLTILRHFTLNILKRDSSKKRGIKGKQKNASWDHSYLLSLLNF